MKNLYEKLAAITIPGPRHNAIEPAPIISIQDTPTR